MRIPTCIYPTQGMTPSAWPLLAKVTLPKGPRAMYCETTQSGKVQCRKGATA